MFEVSYSIIEKLNKRSDFGLFWYFRGSLFEHFQLNKLKLISWFPVTDFFLAAGDAADHVTCPLVFSAVLSQTQSLSGELNMDSSFLCFSLFFIILCRAGIIHTLINIQSIHSNVCSKSLNPSEMFLLIK